MTKVITRVYKSPTHGLMIHSGLEGNLGYTLPGDAVLVAEFFNELEEPPKKKVKKTIEAWANVYPKGVWTLYTTEIKANNFNEASMATFLCNRIACVKLTGEYETEE